LDAFDPGIEFREKRLGRVIAPFLIPFPGGTQCRFQFG